MMDSRAVIAGVALELDLPKWHAAGKEAALSVRTEKDARGATWRVRDIGPGKIERILIDGPSDLIRPGRSCQLVDGGGRNVRPSELSRSAGPIVEHRERTAYPFVLRLSYEARRQIEEEINWCRNDGGAFADRAFRESGGLLYSRSRPGLDEVEVSLASGPGPSSGHHREAMMLSRDEEIEEQLFRTRDRSKYHRCGCWHSHPEPDPNPSPTDMESWALRSKRAGTLSYVSLIAMPSDDGTGWMLGPRFSGWVTYAKGLPGKFVCAKARVVEV